MTAAALVACCAVLLAPTAVADAAFERCAGGDPRGRCSRLPVALDHSGAVPGRLSLLVRQRLRDDARHPRAGVLVALAGGPGQAASPLLDDFAITYGAVLRRRDLVVFDQRGTGRSGLLRCRALERAFRIGSAPGALAAVEPCATSLGPRRRFYATPDSVEDIEALRIALRTPRIALAGVSYGTKVALAYAQRYPARVEFLILDSVVPAGGPDPFERSSLTALPAVLRSVCAGRRCRGITTDAVRDLSRVLARVRSRRMVARYFDSAGRARRTTLTPRSLFETIVAGDLDPIARSFLPGALREAARGDFAHVLRLVGRARANAEIDDPRDISSALYAATTCEDVAFPWSRASPVAQRLAEIRAASSVIADTAFSPFTRADQLASDLFALCARWPLADPPRPVLPGSLPPVRALILAGSEDIRTPASDARAVAAAIPGSRFVVAPHSGHSVATGEGAECASGALSAFLARRVPERCSTDVGYSPVPVPSRRPSRVRIGIGPGRELTLGAILASIEDAALQTYGAPDRGGGLRGGYYVLRASGIALRRYATFPGFRVTGFVSGQGTGLLSVSGPSATAGQVRITARGAHGRLGGRRFRVGNPFISHELAQSLPLRVARASARARRREDRPRSARPL